MTRARPPTWAAVVAGGVAAVGAGASAYGASQQPGGVSPSSLPVTGYNPYADPLLGALSMNAGAGIGQFDPNLYRQSSPVQQLLASAQASGNLTRSQYKKLQEALNYSPDIIREGANLYEAAHPESGGFLGGTIGKFLGGQVGGPVAKALSGGLSGNLPGEKKVFQKDVKAKKGAVAQWQDFLARNNISEKAWETAKKGLVIGERLARSSGYTDLGDLFTKNQEYLGKLPDIQSQYQPVADQLRKGLLSSQGRVGQYLQDLPNLLTGEANPFIDQLRQEALISSQKYGYNPYKGLEQARSDALQRALQLIQGEQVVQAGQQQAALPVTQLRQGGGTTAANLGAGQAQMLAGALGSQQAAQSAQAQTWGNLGGNLLGASAGMFGDLQGRTGPAA